MIRHRWEKLLARARRASLDEVGVLVLVAILAGALWAFAELAEDVVQGKTRTFDERVLLLMRNPVDRSDPVGSEWVEELARDFTGLGGVGVLTFLSLAVVGFLGLQRKWHTVLVLCLAVGGGLLLSSLLKHGFSRPRPGLVPHGSLVYTSSFPSGHSMMSTITYLTLAALLVRTVSGRRIKLYIFSVALVLASLVGTSRVYLGVHWPTDVLAGWTIGAAWAILWWLLTRRLQKAGHVEPESTFLEG
jgi:undecaprenyl-diphosphatase